MILEEQNKMLAEQDAVLKEQNVALKEKDATLKEQKEAFKKQEREIKRKRVLQVCRNYEKGKSPETIAEDLLEPLDVVRKICDICNSIGEEYHPEEVVNRYLQLT